MEDAPYAFLYFQQQVYVTRQGYEGFVPIPTFAGVYQSLKAVRWTEVAAQRAVACNAARRRVKASRSSTWGEWPLCSKIASVEWGTRRWISSD